ncbi:MAG: glycosyltransferase family 4 protein [Dehalococcoidia bacterium]|nr:glycosyltransferase family 4 protein [Chloroflexota bacterium]MCK4242385.1 glycosyltransferase family 4 protein [Dehalococcoidia bacterium]
MKICLLCYRGNKYCGGQGIYLYYLSRELQRMGHEVDVMVGPPYPDIADDIRVHKLESLNLYDRLIEGKKGFLPQDNPLHILTPLNLFELAATSLGMFPEIGTFSIRAYLRIRQLLPHHRFDIVHDNQCLAYGLLQIRALGLPVVATIHHPLPIDTKADLAQTPSTGKKIRRIVFYPPFMQGIVARRLDGVITDSESSAQEIRRIFKVPPSKMRTVYLGVDTDVFRKMDGHKQESNSLIMVGRTEDRKKGIVYLLQALRLLKGDGLRPKLTIVDQVNSGSLALELIKKYELQDMVSFTGRLTTEELVSQYSAADVAITPSVYEGFGLPAAEAMACEVPVIATSAGALPEVVSQGETGILVPPQDPHALASAIKRFLEDESLRRRMGGEGRRWVEKHFSWPEAARNMLQVYEEVLSQRR